MDQFQHKLVILATLFFLFILQKPKAYPNPTHLSSLLRSKADISTIFPKIHTKLKHECVYRHSVILIGIPSTVFLIDFNFVSLAVKKKKRDGDGSHVIMSSLRATKSHTPL